MSRTYRKRYTQSKALRPRRAGDRTHKHNKKELSNRERMNDAE